MTTENETNRRNTGPSGPLYDLLIEKMPNMRRMYGGHTRLDIYGLSKAMGTSHQHIYQILPSGDRPAAKNLSVKLARKLIACSESQGIEKPLTLLDLEPYLPS